MISHGLNRKTKSSTSKTELVISSFGLTIISYLFLQWWFVDNHANNAGHIAALATVILFAVTCLRFVHQWLLFWAGKDNGLNLPMNSCPQKDVTVFLKTLLCSTAILALILSLRALMGDNGTITERLEFFLNIDTGCYMDIASYWYAPEPLADQRRIVFYPMYPAIVWGASKLISNVLVAGTITALLFSAFSGTVLYRLLSLDYPQAQAEKTVWMLYLMPAAFFLTIPMSESVFFFFSLMSYYQARKERWFAAGILGALSAFSRSLGVLILAPLMFEVVSVWIRKKYKIGKGLLSLFCSLIVVLGFTAYLYINKKYYGDPLYFMKIEDKYWDQRMGLFFSTTAYQLDNALADIQMPYYKYALGIWFPNVICCMAALLLIAWASNRIRPSYTLWFIIYYFVAVSPTFLISAPRYLAVSVPLFPAVAELLTSPRRWKIAAVMSALFSTFYLFAFVSLWGVY